ncbi:acetate--CoA ligase family protein, partial [Paracoccaceae bacterium]|nr:acetate--CoA ligase family protein [Paracoccaceae bacterium]
ALVASAATVEREAEGLGFPVVLKTMGLAHKSEANAVHLNLGNLKEVQRALSEMPQGSFLIENMVQGGGGRAIARGCARSGAWVFVNAGSWRCAD